MAFVCKCCNLKGYVTKLIFPTVREESNGLEITTNDFLLIHQTPFARLFPIDGVGGGNNVLRMQFMLFFLLLIF